MASGVAARRQGDEYQDVYGWFRALELLRPTRKVFRVSIEDPSAGWFDDVTIRPVEGSSHTPEFAQVKFHVDETGYYSTNALMERKSKNGRSLLQKAWDTWLILRQENPRLDLLLITTYPWDPNDPIAEHIRYAKRLTARFINGAITSSAKAARDSWSEHLGSPQEDLFRQFLGSVQFRTGFPATAELIDWTAERMEYLGLKHSRDDVLGGGRQIYEWIVAEKDTITREDMLAAIEARSLRIPEATPEPSVALYIHTILKEPLESEGDWELDWRDYFEGQEWLRGHRLHDPTAWNAVMLPEIVDTRESIAADTSCRLLRARGKARLSAWFAIGWVFSRVAGWTIEVDQNGKRWRNDAVPSPDVTLVDELEERGGERGVLAVGISVTGDLSAEVRAYLRETGDPADKLLLVQTSLGLGTSACRSDGDVTALAQLARDRIRTVLGERPKRLLLFYFGPLSGAAFIGAQLNAVAEEIQVYEDQLPGYAPSFLFSIG